MPLQRARNVPGIIDAICVTVKGAKPEMSGSAGFVDRRPSEARLRRFPTRPAMKLRIRQSNKKRVRKVGFLRRNKTAKGKKIIARQRKRYGAYRGAFRK
jgi:ribosomal protein L34